MRKIMLFLFGSIFLLSCNESADSLMSKACKCYKKAQKLNNTDAMMSKLQACTDLTYQANQALIDQAQREDWTDEKTYNRREELSKKYDCNK